MAADHSAWPPTVVPLRYLRVSGIVWGVLAVLLVVGAAAFVMGLGSDPERAWLSFHHNWLFWTSLALGMIVAAISFHLTNSRWSWSIRRFALASAAFLPVALLLWVVNWGGRKIYFHHWLGHIEGDPVLEAKEAWLSAGGMFARDTVALLVLFGMCLWFTYHMLRPDLHGLNGPSVYRWFTGGEWRGARAEAERSRRIALRLGVVTAILFAVLWGLIAIDQAMTMLPHWFSTMFPVTFLVSSFHSALAMLAVMSVIGRAQARLHDQVTPGQYHDLGKLVFAYAVFWMYVNWSQYVVIWYGLLPHEQEFFVQRFNAPFGALTEIMVGCVFLIPFFFLLSRPPKKVPVFLAFVSAIVVFGHWLERFLITVPSVWTHENLPLGFTEIGIALGFAAMFLAPYLWFLKTFPLLPSPAALAAIPAPTFVMPARTRTVEA